MARHNKPVITRLFLDRAIQYSRVALRADPAAGGDG
jgi:hypothetical protein